VRVHGERGGPWQFLGNKRYEIKIEELKKKRGSEATGAANPASPRQKGEAGKTSMRSSGQAMQVERKKKSEIWGDCYWETSKG